MPVKPLTVLQLLPALESGGVERGTLEVAGALVRAGHRALVVSAGGRLVPTLDRLGARHITLPVGRKSIASLLLLPRLRRLFHEERVDIVHARSRIPAWLAWFALSGMPESARPHFVTTVHGLYSVNRYSQIMTRGEVVIAVSDTVRDYVLAHYPATPPERIHVIHRGVDGQQYPYGWKPDAAWQRRFFDQFPAARERLLLTLPGRITRLKGHEAFIALIAALKSRGLPVYGLIAGGASGRKVRYLDELIARVRAMGLESDIGFTGHRDDLKSILAVSNLVLALSTQPEAFGRTTLEALRLGIPTAGLDQGGVGEILRAIYPAGRLPPTDTDDVRAERIARLLSGQPSVPEGDFFPLGTMLEKTLALYSRLGSSGRI